MAQSDLSDQKEATLEAIEMVEKVERALNSFVEHVSATDIAQQVKDMTDRQAELEMLRQLAIQGKLKDPKIMKHLETIEMALVFASSAPVTDVNVFVVVQVLGSFANIMTYINAQQNSEAIAAVHSQLALWSEAFMDTLKQKEEGIELEFDKLKKEAEKYFDEGTRPSDLTWTQVNNFISTLRSIQLKVDDFNYLIAAAQRQLDSIKREAEAAKQRAEQQIADAEAQAQSGRTKVIVGSIFAPFTLGLTGFLIADGLHDQESAAATLELSNEQIASCGKAMEEIATKQRELDQFKASSRRFQSLLVDWATKLGVQMGLVRSALQEKLDAIDRAIRAEAEAAEARRALAEEKSAGAAQAAEILRLKALLAGRA